MGLLVTESKIHSHLSKHLMAVPPAPNCKPRTSVLLSHIIVPLISLWGLQVSPRALFLFQKDTCSTPRWVGLIQSQLYKGCYLPGLSAGNFIIYLKLQIYVYIYILVFVCRHMF